MIKMIKTVTITTKYKTCQNLRRWEDCLDQVLSHVFEVLCSYLHIVHPHFHTLPHHSYALLKIRPLVPRLRRGDGAAGRRRGKLKRAGLAPRLVPWPTTPRPLLLGLLVPQVLLM